MSKVSYVHNVSYMFDGKRAEASLVAEEKLNLLGIHKKMEKEFPEATQIWLESTVTVEDMKEKMEYPPIERKLFIKELELKSKKVSIEKLLDDIASVPPELVKEVARGLLPRLSKLHQDVEALKKTVLILKAMKQDEIDGMEMFGNDN